MLDAEYLLVPFSSTTQSLGWVLDDIHIFTLEINSPYPC